MVLFDITYLCFIETVGPSKLSVIGSTLITVWFFCTYFCDIPLFVAVEVVGPSKRSAISNAFMTVWAVGYMVLAGVAYLFRDRFVFMIVAAAPTALILIPLWYVQCRLRFLIFKRSFVLSGRNF